MSRTDMNSPTTPRVAPSLAPQRLILPAQSPSKHFPMNSTAFSMSEAEAIERAQQGDGVAFETLYGLHKRRVYSLCLRMVGNETGAEDLTQEAFLQVYRKIGTFRQQSAFSTWLHRVAVNVVLMRSRRKKLPVVPLEESLDPAGKNGAQ